MKIPFNKPYLTGKETDYIKEAVASLKLSGNGIFTKKCQQFFENKYDIQKALLTTSCTDALEMAAILINIEPGDEVIMPSYTFVSTANAFVLRGAKIIFCDSRSDHPGIDEDKIEELITSKTKAIVPVHYAGVACNMEKIMLTAEKYQLYVIEDAAQAIDSYFTYSDGTKRALGSIGHLSAFSFHETKNVISGEGGLLGVNDPSFIARSEIIWEKGTNRSSFFRGEVDKYGWVDIGSSFLPSEITAAFLWAQLENLQLIQEKRKKVWSYYLNNINFEEISSPDIPSYACNNAHMFYVVCKSKEDQKKLIKYLSDNDINAVFHYLSLHKSPYYKDKYTGKELPMSNIYANCLIRLPFYNDIQTNELEYICNKINTILS
jgi:dTDP-4-amino-4,6-dideoxygalactose transaminase